MSLLLALLAPGSVEAEVGRIQQAIFAEHGLVSCIALPPLVPVAFLAEARPGLLAGLNASVVRPYRFRAAGLAWQEGWLHLVLETGGAWASLRAAAPAGAGPADGAQTHSGPAAAAFPRFPAFEGFYLGCVEASPEQRERIHPAVPEIGFTSSSLCLMRIEAADPSGSWWRQVTTEVIEEIPLRGRRA